VAVNCWLLAALLPLVFLDGVGGVDPGGVDEVAEFDGAGGEAFFGEGFRFGSTGADEAVVLVELIDLLDEGVGVVKVVEVTDPLVGVDLGLAGGDQRRDIGGFDVGGDEGGLKLGVDVVLGGVVVGVGAVQPLYCMEVCRGMEPSPT
jgi:hypothetical protein